MGIGVDAAARDQEHQNSLHSVLRGIVGLRSARQVALGPRLSGATGGGVHAGSGSGVGVTLTSVGQAVCNLPVTLGHVGTNQAPPSGSSFRGSA